MSVFVAVQTQPWLDGTVVITIVTVLVDCAN